MDDISKCTQTQVYGVCLFLTSCVSSRFRRLLASGKIHKWKFAYRAYISVDISAVNQNTENQMWATAGVIHQGFSGLPSFKPFLKDLFSLRNSKQFYLSHILNLDHACSCFFDIEFFSFLISGQKQVMQGIQVKFNHVATEFNAEISHRF